MPGTYPTRGNLVYDFFIGPTLTPIAVLGNTSAEQPFTIPGIQTNDTLDINFNGVQTAGIGIVNVRVSAANTIQIMFQNSTAGSLTPAAGQYIINIGRLEVSAYSQLPTTAI